MANYTTGTKYNFENRLHSNSTTPADLDLFAIEGNTYVWINNEKEKLNKEFQHKRYEMSGIAPYFTGNYII